MEAVAVQVKAMSWAFGRESISIPDLLLHREGE
jgi:hypothetical protein